jgi:hypothetical protein
MVATAAHISPGRAQSRSGNGTRPRPILDDDDVVAGSEDDETEEEEPFEALQRSAQNGYSQCQASPVSEPNSVDLTSASIRPTRTVSCRL